MRTRLTLRPGQAGTRKLQKKYGERLLAVRYRYDADRRIRLKTIELIEEELPWEPPITARNPDEPVLLHLRYEETDLRQTVKNAGGVWVPERKLWRLHLAAAYGLGLESRIVK